MQWDFARGEEEDDLDCCGERRSRDDCAGITRKTAHDSPPSPQEECVITSSIRRQLLIAETKLFYGASLRRRDTSTSSSPPDVKALRDDAGRDRLQQFGQSASVEEWIDNFPQLAVHGSGFTASSLPIGGSREPLPVAGAAVYARPPQLVSSGVFSQGQEVAEEDTAPLAIRGCRPPFITDPEQTDDGEILFRYMILFRSACV